ncbi:membrane metallo-endopeptidase-like 1 isoform X2 [Clavelina lepadiformis]|uniref:membrane metallo-endopeptidase-like 1 isoform X2 n=1 Tax=Clavelina lepadiformis TaxID=159417 RepID=UPI00404236EB
MQNTKMIGEFRKYLFFCAVCYIVKFAVGKSCWDCPPSKTKKECDDRGRLVECNDPGAMCQIQVRYGGWGNDPMVKKSCKKRYACKNDYRQNFHNAGGKYGSILQCNGGPPTSVCTCCCSKDLCNKDSWECKPRGNHSTSAISKKPKKTRRETQEQICETPDCVRAAARILSYMDRDVNPCEDFYGYACGGFIRDRIIPDDMPEVTTVTEVANKVDKIRKRALETRSEGDRDSIKKAKEFYASCMNTTKIDSLGLEPVLELIKQMGGWPVIGDSFDRDSFNLEKTLGAFTSGFGSTAILSATVGQDEKDSSANIFKISQPKLGLPDRDFYLNDGLRQTMLPAYRKFMSDFITMVAGDKANSATTESVVDQIVQFETDIARAVKSKSETRNITSSYNKVSSQELANEVPGLNWTDYVNAVMSATAITVDADEKIVVYDMNYLKSFVGIINGKYELIQNYLIWSVLQARVIYMSSDLRETRKPFKDTLYGVSAEPARWKVCTYDTEKYFHMPVASLFVSEAFSENNKNMVEQMFENLRQAFRKMLATYKWIDRQTRNKAVEKLEFMRAVLAYPDYIVDKSNPKLDYDYEDVVIKPNQFVKNIQTMIAWEKKEEFDKLKTAVDFNEWTTLGPAVVYAYHSPSKNQINFPAAIMQPPFLDIGQPTSMNYGAIGSIIGHEVSHGFDDNGGTYDRNGNINNWWTERSKNNFKERAQCIIDQYSAIRPFPDIDRNLNGKLSAGENIADNGELWQAFMAYKKWQVKNPQGDLRLPGFGNFTQDQLFFLAHAQTHCQHSTRQFSLQNVISGYHVPGKYRVEIPSINIPAFGKAYNCKRGVDRMYPNKNTCRVW